MATKTPERKNLWKIILEGTGYKSAKKLIPPDLTKKLEAISAKHKNTALIQYFYQPMVVACQGNCKTAGDINPCINVEGFDTKPESDEEFPNKYCVRNCAGCDSYDPRKSYLEILKEVKSDARKQTRK